MHRISLVRSILAWEPSIRIDFQVVMRTRDTKMALIQIRPSTISLVTKRVAKMANSSSIIIGDLATVRRLTS